MKCMIFSAMLVCALVFTGSSANAVNIVGYYAFDGTYVDSSGNSGNAVPTQNAGQVNLVGAGFRGGAVDINDPAASGGGNTGGSLNLPINVNPAFQAGGDDTVSFGGWFNLDSNAGFPGAAAADNGGWDRGIHLFGNNWGIASGGNLNNVAGAPTGQWTYVVGTFDRGANQAILYVGDDSLTQTTFSGGRADGQGGNGLVQLEIGRYDNQDLDARIDDFVVWDDALTPQQANAVRNLRTSALDYNPLQAEQLFDLFDAGVGEVSIAGTTWSLTSNLNPTNPGEVFNNGGGSFAVVLNTIGDGLVGRPGGGGGVPEPATAVLLVMGLGAGVLRRRRRD